MKRLIQKLIQSRAKAILAKYRPIVVAVTGSVGKTSTRNALALVLDERFRVRAPEANYNNEFGVPLTIIGAKSPGHSIFGWLKVLWKAQRLLGKRDAHYPTLLALEYGADHPGDIKALCETAAPHVSVLTAISPVHVEHFGTIECLTEEKSAIVRCANPDGLVVMNADDPLVLALKNRASAPVCTYGFSSHADIRAEHYELLVREQGSFEPRGRFAEIHFDMVHAGDRASVVIPETIGRAQASAALAAAAVGLHFGISLQEAAKRLGALRPQAGRLRAIPGIKGSLILDDSYNAAPASMAAALDVLAKWPVAEQSRRVAVLGTMAELGTYSEREHRMIGMLAATSADLLVAVGEPARDIVRGACEAGMDESKTHWFAHAVEAGRWLDACVKTGDIVLVKGSQSARMEKAVKDIMAEPARAAELLVRQFGKWLEEASS